MQSGRKKERTIITNLDTQFFAVLLQDVTKSTGLETSPPTISSAKVHEGMLRHNVSDADTSPILVFLLTSTIVADGIKRRVSQGSVKNAKIAVSVRALSPGLGSIFTLEKNFVVIYLG
jgi:hypothetical protein